MGKEIDERFILRLSISEQLLKGLRSGGGAKRKMTWPKLLKPLVPENLREEGRERFIEQLDLEDWLGAEGGSLAEVWGRC